MNLREVKELSNDLWHVERDGKPAPLVISVDEFCYMLSIGKTTAYRMLRSEVESFKIGNRRLVVLQSVHKFVQRSITSEKS